MVVVEVWSAKVYVGSVQTVTVAVVDSIVSRSVCVVSTVCGCGGHHCQQKCMWSLYRQCQWLRWTVLSVEMKDKIE